MDYRKRKGRGGERRGGKGREAKGREGKGREEERERGKKKSIPLLYPNNFDDSSSRKYIFFLTLFLNMLLFCVSASTF